MHEAVEAITLKVVPFEEHSHIVTLFSKEQGKICVALKQSKKLKREGFSPLLSVEAEIIPSEKEVWKCRRMEVLNSFPRLRQRLDTLRYAVGTTQFLSQILPSHAPSHILYDHFHAFLMRIAHFDAPHVAASAFLAKFCASEGTLGKHGALSHEEAALCERLAKSTFEELQGVMCEKSLLRKLLTVATG